MSIKWICSVMAMSALAACCSANDLLKLAKPTPLPQEPLFQGSHPPTLSQLQVPAVASKPAENGKSPDAPPKREVSREMTAVTMNYCRASFHRIRQNPSKRVMLEEQSKILNNLNLTGIGDEEVISLYTAVLDEVGQETIAEKEHHVIENGYQRTVRQQALARAFVMGAEVGTAQYASAVRTGANSWWDYRNLTANRDVDAWKVDKTRLLQVADKSSKFMDTFWKMAQKKNIPDEWLVRGDDLDRLDRAVAEPNAEVRLRILQRMEKFLTYYPPYWYHVARTQQALGQLFAASNTYERLRELGHGHFRKDDMLAAALANRAAIQASLRQPDAPATARQALEYSNTCWQANLVCARILQQNKEVASAEEAILRNLDVNLEKNQSLTCLVALYCDAGDKRKLAARLGETETVAVLPTTLLLKCAAALGTDKLPAPAMNQIVCTFYGLEQHSGKQLSFVAQQNWEVQSATANLVARGVDYSQAKSIDPQKGNFTVLQFAPPEGRVARLENGNVQLDLHYPDGPPIRLHMRRMNWTPEMVAYAEDLANREREVAQNEQQEKESKEMFRWFSTPQSKPVVANKVPRNSFVITSVEMGKEQIALLDRFDLDSSGSSSKLMEDRGTEHKTGFRALPATLDRTTPEAHDEPNEDIEQHSAHSAVEPVSPPKGMSLLGLPLKSTELQEAE
ncbi:MAG: hypothetical protein U0903_04800 [Planctomycetales bacterium]